MTRTVAVIDWLVSNVVFWTLAILGMIYGVKGAFVVVVVLTILYTLLWGLIALGRYASTALGTPEQFPIIPGGVPTWLHVGSDICMAILMVYTGHWMLWFLMIVQTWLEIYSRKPLQVPAPQQVTSS